MKRLKLYIISCLALALLVSCNVIEKPTAKAKQVKETMATKLNTKEKMVEIDGQTIYFKQIGENKPPLLMLHGFGGSSNGFGDIYPKLAKDHTIIAVDILGFGHSSKPMDFQYSFPNQANLYYKLMKKLGYDKFVILGHSMGGEISLNLTYLYPNAITHLILSDATGIESLQQGEGSIKPNLSTDLHTVSAITDYHENKVKYKREDTEHYTELSKMRQRRLIIDANEIHVPTLIIWGRHDKSVSWKNGETYHQLLKNSTFHIIEQGYHAPFRQEPKEFMEYVQTFFEKHRLAKND
ncbi:alpha/beta hydrolase [Bacillus sp. DX1.1]|uniref:alpha/beta fold hydrolase n=1 Tax=unclassified Bacillus (in: firmicutes) TaxID=185979 RepID=UPI0025705AED|nr:MULTISPECIES: alpha/beta hydrolase [unclassified Bacillus (in: firmicutes)]MDM5155923.1 alpha/beta hydrolase [Bacillus sp. DX1.1]WJE80217.1 alpha/beta hydrolase [Bacillus sp. DX3.1]